jgi:uncharacterized membrane protein
MTRNATSHSDNGALPSLINLMQEHDGAGGHDEADAAESEPPSVVVRGERRWPAAIAILFLIILPFLLPERLTLGPKWVFPTAEALLLVAIIVHDPGRIDRRGSTIRRLSIGLLAVFIVGDVTMTAALVVDLVRGVAELNDAQSLLATGALVWINNNVLFGLLYWELDGGGPAARVFSPAAYPDLAFPEHMNPEIRPPGWRPIFLDYLYLGLTNGLAFSPTDVMPCARWAKVMMALQSLISLVVLSLVIARAVNIFN